MSELSMDATSKIVPSILFLAVGQAPQKTPSDKMLAIQIAENTLPVHLDWCKQTFFGEPTKTLAIHCFFFRRKEKKDRL